MNNIIRKLIKEQIDEIFKSSLEELDANITRDPKQIAMARNIMGDDSIVVLNKLNFGEELSFDEQDEARENYLTDYIISKAKLSGEKRMTNPINVEDLESIFSKGGGLLDLYLNELINKFSNVEQISNLERESLLNTGSLDTAYNSSDNIAKKYIIKMLVNLDIPQAGDNKWTNSDSIEVLKAYQMALKDDDFKDALEKILWTKGKQNSKLYKKLRSIIKEPSSIER